MFTQELSEFYSNRAGLAKSVDRKLCFSYKALEFLQSHGFRIEEAFPVGIPYLSRQECVDLSKCFLAAEQDTTKAVIDITSCSEGAQEFYRYARRHIQKVSQDVDPVGTSVSGRKRCVCSTHLFVRKPFATLRTPWTTTTMSTTSRPSSSASSLQPSFMGEYVAI